MFHDKRNFYAVIGLTFLTLSISLPLSASEQRTMSSSECQYEVEYNIANQWPSGYQADVIITNLGSSAINDWSLSWEKSPADTFSQGWNVEFTASLTQMSATTNTDWNRSIPSDGGKVSFGFQMNTDSTPEVITTFYLDSASCESDTITPAPAPTTFVRANGTQIIDANGDNLIFRGMGIGGWMVMEPYMFEFNQNADEGQHKILDDISAIIGEERTKTFHQAWLDNFFTQQDVVELKRSGFNTIRLPMHFNLFTLPIEQEPIFGQDTWLNEGFERVDELLAWCKENEIYLILDLHAAPGGQGYNGNISDYDPTKPSLWESEENQRKMIALWGKIAERYANERWIAAYDPMNEPNWGFDDIPDNKNGCTEVSNIPLREMYSKLIPEIRKYDKNHLIAIEGNCWGNNHSNLWPLPVSDDNVAISFHKYWNENNDASIQPFTQMRDQYNVPLWMSESGENSNTWYREAVELLESNNIGWSWWTWKKMEHTSGSFSVKKPDGFQDLLTYWEQGGTMPDAEQAYSVLMTLVENLKLHNAHRNDDAINALTQAQVKCDSKSSLPLDSLISALSYCQMNGIETQEGFVGYFSQGDWVAYPFHIPESGNYVIEFDVATQNNGASFTVEEFGGWHQYGTATIPNTNGWTNWQRVSKPVSLAKGYQHIAIVSDNGDVNFKAFRIRQY
ncbi:cellulase family glycosylhydrolase [Vibrio sp. ZSDE26]|uniref:cellulase n=1 Tax=Vibrio amylolyticus TaxID=2847292 RepID=A0A9X1XH63_9VIBR|nr:cellulase family glycosylhydrolase [Vibrio amylolyticus]MCK6262952.1 cellulase family glycosylhydrolase [Vibrio amylolyticus]